MYYLFPSVLFLSFFIISTCLSRSFSFSFCMGSCFVVIASSRFSHSHPVRPRPRRPRTPISPRLSPASLCHTPYRIPPPFIHHLPTVVATARYATLVSIAAHLGRQRQRRAGVIRPGV
ncbi:hypothetical protein JAAARDRAFT_305475 [Jaapia argillacea MUCL 33604]|uniref:REJ domain-containing protein n=1 Tax=Jaapia argillacea MUCL 33604 TaxID=933084 RepID=A0A067Q0T9_9AGAM|nr:hypothetical protein JAAARDRAFT_305475 [Jaapia argillacea MUCL 33604]